MAWPRLSLNSWFFFSLPNTKTTGPCQSIQLGSHLLQNQLHILVLILCHSHSAVLNDSCFPSTGGLLLTQGEPSGVQLPQKCVCREELLCGLPTCPWCLSSCESFAWRPTGSGIRLESDMDTKESLFPLELPVPLNHDGSSQDWAESRDL